MFLGCTSPQINLCIQHNPTHFSSMLLREQLTGWFKMCKKATHLEWPKQSWERTGLKYYLVSRPTIKLVNKTVSPKKGSDIRNTEPRARKQIIPYSQRFQGIHREKVTRSYLHGKKVPHLTQCTNLIQMHWKLVYNTHMVKVTERKQKKILETLG